VTPYSLFSFESSWTAQYLLYGILFLPPRGRPGVPFSRPDALFFFFCRKSSLPFFFSSSDGMPPPQTVLIRHPPLGTSSPFFPRSTPSIWEAVSPRWRLLFLFPATKGRASLPPHLRVDQRLSPSNVGLPFLFPLYRYPPFLKDRYIYFPLFFFFSICPVTRSVMVVSISSATPLSHVLEVHPLNVLSTRIRVARSQLVFTLLMSFLAASSPPPPSFPIDFPPPRRRGPSFF